MMCGAFKPVAIALCVSSPVLLHFAILSDRPALAACLSALFAVAMLWQRLTPPLRVALLGIALLACLWAALSETAALNLVYIAPVAIYMAVGAVFGRTLLPGREPLVCRIARLDRGGTLPDDLAAHARAVTWAWTLLLIAFIVVSIALALFGTPETWSWFNNVWAFVLMASLFAGEYVFRLVRFRHYQHNNPLRVAMLMARHAPELLG
jgi:uncharacterized membrane protein